MWPVSVLQASRGSDAPREGAAMAANTAAIWTRMVENIIIEYVGRVCVNLRERSAVKQQKKGIKEELKNAQVSEEVK